MPDTGSMKFTAADIDESASVPLYQQIYDLLRARIMDGTMALNDRLPAEQDLTRALGVSRITVKRAMNELAVAGLVRRQRGIGTVVIYDVAAPIVKGSFETMIDGLTRMGLETEVQLLDCTVGTASPAISEALHLKGGKSVQRIVRLRRLDGEPFSYLVTYIPYDIADGYDDAQLASESLIKLLEQAGHAPVEAEQTITATSAEPAVAANLGVAPGSPLLRIHRIMKDAAGRPVQDITAHYRADRFEYHMRLNRNNAAETDWTTEK
ncbi:MAG: GntR family transcriptional regulator [Pseudomonadota bacterium]|nr:GntR family transcriptional regulator [Pseudomonadota bacterium]